MPPEVVRNDVYDMKVDIWSAGIVTYMLLTSRPPFYGAEKAEVYRAILEDPLTFDEKDWSNISYHA